MLAIPFVFYMFAIPFVFTSLQSRFFFKCLQFHLFATCFQSYCWCLTACDPFYVIRCFATPSVFCIPAIPFVFYMLCIMFAIPSVFYMFAILVTVFHALCFVHGIVHCVNVFPKSTIVYIMYDKGAPYVSRTVYVGT